MIWAACDRLTEVRGCLVSLRIKTARAGVGASLGIGPGSLQPAGGRALLLMLLGHLPFHGSGVAGGFRTALLAKSSLS